MRIISLVTLVAFCLLAGGFSLYIRIANPDMTETRLLLTYWPEYLVILGGVAVTLVWVKTAK